MRESVLQGVDYDLIRTGDPRNRTAFIDGFAKQFQTYGFGVVSNGPINMNRIRQLYEVSKQVFAMRDVVKRQYEEEGRQRGYASFGVETAQGHALPDNKEFWHIGRAPEELPPGYPDEALRVYRPNRLPTLHPAFGLLSLEVYVEREAFAVFLLACIEKAFGFPTGYLTGMVKFGDTILRIIRYPSMAERWIAGAVRSGAHTDINLITGLVESVAGGLQILRRGGDSKSEADWLPINTQNTDSAWNAGDMLSHMTDDIPSTIHRVVNPEDPEEERWSGPQFLHPRPECLLVPLPGVKRSPVITRKFLLERLVEIKVLEEMPPFDEAAWLEYGKIDYSRIEHATR